MRPKVFGIGLNKTGTTSLKAALKRLGYKRHMSWRGDLLAHYLRGELEAVFNVIDRWNTFEDFPYPLMYRELFERYGPRTRFVLTKRRTAEVWLNSLKRHSVRTNPDRHCRMMAYGYAYPFGAEAHHLEIYEQHLLDVRTFFKLRNAEHQLIELCWETGDGWPELCAFLGKSVPEEPFPRENVGDTVKVRQTVIDTNVERIGHQLRLLCPGEYADDEQVAALVLAR